MNSRNLIVGMAWVVTVVAAALPAHAGIVVISRESTLEASGQITGDSFDLSDQFTTTLGSYDNAIGDTLTPASGGETTASASQQSSVPALDSLDGVTATGDASAQVAELDAIAAQALSRFLLEFQVADEAEAVTLQGNVQATFDAQARVTLTSEGGGTPFQIGGQGTGEQLTFDETLNLAPGTYTLLAEALVTGTPTPNTASFNLIASQDGGNGGGNGGGVIPLPPALLPGLMLLGLAATRLRALRR